MINNVDVTAETDAARIKDALVQLFSPVRWTETIESVANAGVEFEVEMGPGKVLSGLVKRIDKRVDGAAINDRHHCRISWPSCNNFDVCKDEL